MANANTPFGLQPVSHLQGDWNGVARTYCIPSTDTNAYAIGDPVTIAGSADTAGIATVVLATAGSTNTVLGAIVGMGGAAFGGAIGVDPVSQDRIIIPATKTKNYYVMVADDPYLIYAVQEDATQAALAAADIGLNISLKAGTNNGYISTWVLDQATKATSAALQMKLLGVQQTQDKLLGNGAGCVFLCTINQHPFKATVAGQ